MALTIPPPPRWELDRQAFRLVGQAFQPAIKQASRIGRLEGLPHYHHCLSSGSQALPGNWCYFKTIVEAEPPG